jgi:hypothetical protein
MVGHIGALQMVVIYMVSLSIECADCDAMFDVTVGGLMTKTVAVGTLFDDWGCD